MKKNMKYSIITSLVFSVSALLPSVNARENESAFSGKKSAEEVVASVNAACSPAKAKIIMEINNVRTTILTGGDMWWETGNSTSKYEIPKNSGSHSLFAGALWIGGLDQGGNLKVAAMTYRQTGNDFWPGTIDTTDVTTNDQICGHYDKHFKITRQEVDDYIAWNKNPSNYPGYTVPSNILDWPGNYYFLHETRQLAPYHDGNNNGIYDPVSAPAGTDQVDFPNYNVTGIATCDPSFIFGDETLWWVFNDVGNIHSETNGLAIGLEIQAQAFAFATNDELNNMTFYKYKIVNRSTFQMQKTYFGQWVDPDLGCASDDYVGCDVARGLGYCYNGDNEDGPSGCNGITSYGTELPAVGVDFFEGPVADFADGLDNDRDGCVDGTKSGASCIPESQLREKIIMSKFVYYNNDYKVTGNPQNASHYYNYLSGKWKDGLPFTYGGDAYNEPGPVCDFMFPGSTDPTGWGTGGVPQSAWSEATVGNTPADRRFLQSAGPFTLDPGALNYITVGAVWARAPKGSPNTDAVKLLQVADDKAQSLFDNCFKVLDGPDAPDLAVQELDKELIITVSPKTFIDPNNPTKTGLNTEDYYEIDPTIPLTYTLNAYKFEGYQIFQLKDAAVSSGDLYNPDKARLVKQFDIKNGTGQLVNFDFDNSLNAYIPKEMVNGKDSGVFHSFDVKTDLFASGNAKLINHKQYYYMAVSYGYNEYKKYDQNNTSNIDGQKKPYKQGRKNVRLYTGIPHIPSPEAEGTIQNSTYGYGPKITRIEGWGNGGNVLDLTEESVNTILANGRDLHPEYQNSRGPIKVKVIDPLNVPNASFTFKMLDSVTAGNLSDAYWSLTNNSTGEVIYSKKTIAFNDERIIPEWGISITVRQVSDPGNGESGQSKNGILEGNTIFADYSKVWLIGLPDFEGTSSFNWIRSGKVTSQSSATPFEKAFDDIQVNASYLDISQDYEKMLSGWSPYILCSSLDAADANNAGAHYCLAGPGWESHFNDASPSSYKTLANLASVDVVITSDKTKWTRCPVLEESDDSALAIGKAQKLFVRKSPSVDRNGKNVNNGGSANSNDPNASDFINATGMGWFPGYAINVETGERMNMAFGEDSRYHNQNGDDMIWNPTGSYYDNGGSIVLGGRHYIYVYAHLGDSISSSAAFPLNCSPIYDNGKYFRTHLAKYPSGANPTFQMARVWRDCIWAGIPILTDNYAPLGVYGQNLNIPSDVKVRLRVMKSYRKGYSSPLTVAAPTKIGLKDTAVTPQNNNLPMYTFNTSDIGTVKSDVSTAKTSLDLINVVPNPYYAYSSYETNRLDNRIKITNLPEKCTITIYTLNGTLIRKFKKDDPKTSQDWDLKNQVNVPISSGLYIIHVDVPGVGEKIVKWFGVMRPTDLESY